MTTPNELASIEKMARDRAALLKNAFVMFPRMEHAYNEIRNLHQLGVPGPRAECIVLSGPSGSGKSHVLNFYRNEHPSERVPIRDADDPTKSGTRLRDEIVFVEAPSPASRRALIDKIQAAMQPEPLPVRLTLGERRERLIEMLRKADTKLLIIDEFQHLIDRRSKRVVLEASDLIKSLLNAAVCPIVLSGTPEILRILREDTQLKSRVYSLPALDPFDWEDPSERNQFIAYLTEAEDCLGFEEPSGLAALDCARRIHMVSGGLLGETSRLLTSASEIATRATLSCITNECLAQAVDRAWLMEKGKTANPFRSAKVPSRQVEYR